MKATEQYHMDNTMEQRLRTNPNDMDAIEFFQKKESQKLIYQQYNEMMNEYPESFGKILMLYINVKINGHAIEAFCDSGAQATIMSKKLAQECQIDHLIDTRFAGTAVGVGTGVILGRIHLVQLQINDTYYFPCSVTVMDNPTPASSTESGKPSGKEMPFLFGLDMMKRHTCVMDLAKGVIQFRLAPGKYLETPFLHEKDLTSEQGGTKGFDADKANAEFLKSSMKEDKNDGDKMDEADPKE